MFQAWVAFSSVQGNFNKMAFIKKMLAITPRADAEWIWWTDAGILRVQCELPVSCKGWQPAHCPAFASQLQLKMKGYRVSVHIGTCR